MRAPLALALLLLPALASATKSTPPWQFEGSVVEGSGLVGEPVTVTVAVRANAAMRERILLAVPLGVGAPAAGSWEVDLPAGASASHSWTLVPEREGFWMAVARPESPGFGAACGCAYGWSAATEGRVGTTPDSVVPAAVLARETRVSPAAEGRVVVEHVLTPRAAWLAHATLRASLVEGSTFLCDACARASPDENATVAGPGDGAPVSVSAAFLARGDDVTVTVADAVEVAFAAPEDPPFHPLAQREEGCFNVRIDAQGNERERWGCDTPSDEWLHALPLQERLRREGPFLEAAFFAGAFAFVALAFAARRG